MNDQSSSPKPRGSLHPHDFRILLALLEEPRHGYGIVKEVEARSGKGTTLYPANLYRRLRDLTAARLIEECPPPEGAPPEPRRTYLRVTDLGREEARREARRLQTLVRAARDHDLLPEV